MNVNVWDVTEAVEQLILAGRTVSPDRLADPGVPGSTSSDPGSVRTPLASPPHRASGSSIRVTIGDLTDGGLSDPSASLDGERPAPRP